MKKLKKLIIILGCIAVVYGGYYFYKNSQFNRFEDRTRDYLVNEQKIPLKEIQSIDAFQAKGGDSGITISVIFEDEPNIKYNYKSYDGEIKQSDTISLKDGRQTRGKHSVTN
ncbi:DUF3139 domain-containing protein [Paenibacillus caui]|uniref:DUF3139 domain-containing protein n=1 Tax=Paenibacillus caui TaxID=2873927 RepID=UPI001CA8412B|nr:DUF3139 domain-containing protein [Paenibacillus caui]